tara:strand:+ start:144 stop:494 length:351 start_codon:yes stop_codon:yes gene_type:complete
MKIQDWEGLALIIGAGDIGNSMADYLSTESPKLNVIVCGRNLTNQDGIYLDLEDDHSFTSLQKSISLFKNPLRIVINTSGFLHSERIKPEKRISHVTRPKIIKNFSINAIAPLLIA